ncbi:hypothetical protein D3C85_844290 [compost metagenome]
MALTDVEKVRILIGDVEGSPFYQLFTDDEIQAFLDLNGGNVMQAARLAAIAASMQLAGYSSRERTGDIEVWSNLSTAYLKALENLINDKNSTSIPSGLMPYAAGISWADICANNATPDNVRPALTEIRVCDTCGCKCTPTASNPFDVCNCGC